MNNRMASCMCRRLERIGAVLVVALVSVFSSGAAMAQIGACCLCTGQCIDNVSLTACDAQGGLLYTGSTCAQINCRPWGSCCFPADCADQTFIDDCQAAGGTFFQCQTCAQNPCGGVVYGACCLCTGQCIDNLTPAQCQAQGGLHVANTACTQVTCRPRGACCLSGNICIDNVFVDVCAQQGGTFYQCQTCLQLPNCGGGVPSCCFCDGTCQILGQAQCIAAGGIPTAGACPANCEPYGACCFPGVGCQDNVAQSACPPGAEYYQCLPCSQTPCLPQACCLCDGFCVDADPAACLSLNGQPQGPGTTCANLICNRRGACCLGADNCVDNVDEGLCLQDGGVFFVCQSCASVSCPARGACCFSCQPPGPTPPCPNPTPAGPPCIDNVTQAQCVQNLHGVYRGDGTVCFTPPVGQRFCKCPGDVNGDGVTNAADFTILAGSFGGGNPNCLLRTQGDLNCDGVVNAADFTILAGNFGCR